MAGEITIQGGLSFIKGTKKAGLAGNHLADMAGDHYVQRVDNISTTEESVSKGDIATLGWCQFKNVGVGTLRVGGVTGAYVISMAPGQSSGAIKWATNAIFAICDDVGGQLEILLLEV